MLVPFEQRFSSISLLALADLRRLVLNEWVRFFVRDPQSGRFFRQRDGSYIPEDGGGDWEPNPPSDSQAQRRQLTRKEDFIYWTGVAVAISSCAWPLWEHGGDAIHPWGIAVALCGTGLALPVLAFSRRYLHGEHMFGRFVGLSAALVTGFNAIALAPSLEHAMHGWSLFGFVVFVFLFFIIIIV